MGDNLILYFQINHSSGVKPETPTKTFKTPWQQDKDLQRTYLRRLKMQREPYYLGLQPQ
jgi:hypothetical protein